MVLATIVLYNFQLGKHSFYLDVFFIGVFFFTFKSQTSLQSPQMYKHCFSFLNYVLLP